LLDASGGNFPQASPTSPSCARPTSPSPANPALDERGELCLLAPGVPQSAPEDRRLGKGPFGLRPNVGGTKGARPQAVMKRGRDPVPPSVASSEAAPSPPRAGEESTTEESVGYVGTLTLRRDRAAGIERLANAPSELLEA